jgi:hypothetical protein
MATLVFSFSLYLNDVANMVLVPPQHLSNLSIYYALLIRLPTTLTLPI